VSGLTDIFTWMCGTTPTKGIVTQGSKGGYQQNKGAEAAQILSYKTGFLSVSIFRVSRAFRIENIATSVKPPDDWMCGTTPTKGIVTQGSKGGYQQNKGAEAAQMSKITGFLSVSIFRVSRAFRIENIATSVKPPDDSSPKS
jgi:hypothetical protein